VDRRAEALGKSRRGREVLDYLESVGRPATAAEIRLHTGAGPAVLRTLAARGALRGFEQARRPEAAPSLPPRPSLRSPSEQEAALSEIREAISRRVPYTALLQGVTGSGKTEVYLRSISAALEAGRGSIWLVPEIALTPVFARELLRQFGDQAAVLHS